MKNEIYVLQGCLEDSDGHTYAAQHTWLVKAFKFLGEAENFKRQADYKRVQLVEMGKEAFTEEFQDMNTLWGNWCTAQIERKKASRKEKASIRVESELRLGRSMNPIDPHLVHKIDGEFDGLSDVSYFIETVPMR